MHQHAGSNNLRNVVGKSWSKPFWGNKQISLCLGSPSIFMLNGSSLAHGKLASTFAHLVRVRTSARTGVAMRWLLEYGIASFTTQSIWCPPYGNPHNRTNQNRLWAKNRWYDSTEHYFVHYCDWGCHIQLKTRKRPISAYGVGNHGSASYLLFGKL